MEGRVPRRAVLVLLAIQQAAGAPFRPHAEDTHERNLQPETSSQRRVSTHQVAASQESPTCSAGYTWFANPPMISTPPTRCPPKRNRQWHTSACEWTDKHPDGAYVGLFHIGKTGGSTVSKSLQNVIGDYAINISEMHTGSQKRGGGQGFPFEVMLVTTRDPVDRTISAFNYELDNGKPSYLIAAMQKCFPGVDKDQKITGAANDFAMSLTDPGSDCGKLARRCLTEKVGAVDPNEPPDFQHQIGYCGHLNMNHEFYMGMDRNGMASNLNQARMGRAELFLIRASSLEEDLQAAFDWLCLPNVDMAKYLQNEVPDLLMRTKPDGTQMSSRHEDTVLTDEARESLRQFLGVEYAILEELEMLAANGKDRGAARSVALVDETPAWHEQPSLAWNS